MSPAERVRFAQDFFRFAYRIGTPISGGFKVEPSVALGSVVFGAHALELKDLELSADSFALCGTLLERLGYRLLAMELNSALERKFGSWQARICHHDDLVRNASTVVWIIRNAVAHDIFDPVWKINDWKFQDRRFEVPGVLVFDTKGLNGNSIKRLDFGGPVALFRLSEKILTLIK